MPWIGSPISGRKSTPDPPAAAGKVLSPGIRRPVVDSSGRIVETEIHCAEKSVRVPKAMSLWKGERMNENEQPLHELFEIADSPHRMRWIASSRSSRTTSCTRARLRVAELHAFSDD